MAYKNQLEGHYIPGETACVVSIYEHSKEISYWWLSDREIEDNKQPEDVGVWRIKKWKK